MRPTNRTISERKMSEIEDDRARTSPNEDDWQMGTKAEKNGENPTDKTARGQIRSEGEMSNLML